MVSLPFVRQTHLEKETIEFKPAVLRSKIDFRFLLVMVALGKYKFPGLEPYQRIQFSAKWNANSLLKGLNFDHRFHFEWR